MFKLFPSDHKEHEDKPEEEVRKEDNKFEKEPEVAVRRDSIKEDSGPAPSSRPPFERQETEPDKLLPDTEDFACLGERIHLEDEFMNRRREEFSRDMKRNFLSDPEDNGAIWKGSMVKQRRMLKPDWKENHVYLVQFPRTKLIPSASPYCLKLETWLRLADIPYMNISNEFKHWSPKGQVPFIELNGRVFSDSNDIIEHLKKEVKNPDQRLSPQDNAHAEAIHALIENSLKWVYMYSRNKDNKWIFGPEGLGSHVRGLKGMIAKFFGKMRFSSKIKKAVMANGIGRNSPAEVLQFAKEQLGAVSVLLGEREFFFGNMPTTIDATAFAHLAQFLYTPQFDSEVKKYMETCAPNLVRYVERMRAHFWPDWQNATQNLSMDSNWRDSR